MFEERYRVEGGRFFDPETMRAQINNEIGVKAFEGMRSDNAFMPRGWRRGASSRHSTPSSPATSP